MSDMSRGMSDMRRGMSAIREYREMGDSWPKAIRSTIELRARVGWTVVHVGRAISTAGGRLLSPLACRP